MCIRLALKDSIDQLKTNLHIHFPPNTSFTENYNLAPGNSVSAIHFIDEKIKLSEMIWGLHISHNKIPLLKVCNDTVEQDSALQDLVTQNKCLIPVSGFYQWDKNDDFDQPYYFYIPDTPLFTLAGIWTASVVDIQKVVYSFTILTRKAPTNFQEKTSQLPVIVPADKHKQWLEDLDFTPKGLSNTPFLHYYKVSSHITDSSRNDSSLISPLL